ncbi:MAG: NADH-quinone oxidoreductase subunit [Thermovirga sp.]|jgi:NADH-quinone oxidoreductase subunit E|nr:MAG: NADH dehydrogenase (Ubiquinone) 24 kDa subunit [Thermovirga lienii]MDN5318313.1 NADH-quinone oxidoreductase subunit [Thermovirga sp.]MDN5367707.1 NADH-quinone oxidoreductase subunit [Thermovirga sp.]
MILIKYPYKRIKFASFMEVVPLKTEIEAEDKISDLKPLKKIVKMGQREGWGLIKILQQVQVEYGYLPKDLLKRTAEMLKLPYGKVFGVATFYAQFHLTPRGRHIIQQCDGTACHVKGGVRVGRFLREELGIGPGETTEDLKFTYEVVYCLGSCGLAPVAMVDGRVYGELSVDKMKKILENLE